MHYVVLVLVFIIHPGAGSIVPVCPGDVIVEILVTL